MNDLTNTESVFVRHEACPSCNSTNNLARYSDGHAWCFSSDCSYFEPATEELLTKQQTSYQRFAGAKQMAGIISEIKERRISEETCRKFNVKVEYSSTGEINKHHYPYYSRESLQELAVKTRYVEDKQFSFSGENRDLGLFGHQTCSVGGGKFITICEGELDALSISEMFDRKWDVVSLRNGAQAAKKELQENLQWLEDSYEQIVLCFDTDNAGKTALDSVKDLFSPNKLKICTLPMKDANEMLMSNRIKDFVSCWWAAKQYRPDGIIAGEETWNTLINDRKISSIPYPWEGLNKLTKGIRPFELVTVTSGSGMGKSHLVREIQHHLFTETDDKIGVLALEESITRTALGIMSMAANKPLHLDEEADTEDFKPYWDATLGQGRFYLLDHWGSTNEDSLMSHVRYMAKALECKWIVLDHLSIVVSSQEGGDERKNIDAIMTKLRSLVQELGIGLFLVSHLRRSNGTAHEDGGRISLSELRGSQAIAQLSDIVIGLERDQQHESEHIRNVTTLRVLKNRYTGLTGPATYLKYQADIGRMQETGKPIGDVQQDDDF